MRTAVVGPARRPQAQAPTKSNALKCRYPRGWTTCVIPPPVGALAVTGSEDVASGPVAASENIFAWSPDRQRCILKWSFVDLQLSDLRSVEVGWLWVCDDLSQAEADHESRFWRLLHCDDFVRNEGAKRVSVAQIAEVEDGVAYGHCRPDVGSEPGSRKIELR
jgi:hypothetical protein